MQLKSKKSSPLNSLFVVYRITCIISFHRSLDFWTWWFGLAICGFCTRKRPGLRCGPNPRPPQGRVRTWIPRGFKTPRMTPMGSETPQTDPQGIGDYKQELVSLLAFRGTHDTKFFREKIVCKRSITECSNSFFSGFPKNKIEQLTPKIISVIDWYSFVSGEVLCW